MDHAYFTMPLHPLGRSYTATLREDREIIILADGLGFTEAYVGEHATDRAETVTSSRIFLASLKDATRRIRLGTGTVNLPNNHPLQVAAEVAMLDHLLEGRFIFGISPGGLASDAEAFGNLRGDRPAMFREAIDHILALWTEPPPLDRRGTYWTISTRATHMPEIGMGEVVRPYQQPHPPIVVTVVAPHSASATQAGQRGWQMISANFLQPVWVASHGPLFAEGRRAAGQAMRAGDWRVARSICVADDGATARAYGRGAGSPYRHYYASLMAKLVKGGRANLFKPSLETPDSALTLESVLDDLVIAGTVNDVVDQILAFRARVGDFGTLVYAGHDWADAALARRSMVLFADQVMPKVRAALKGARASH